MNTKKNFIFRLPIFLSFTKKGHYSRNSKLFLLMPAMHYQMWLIFILTIIFLSLLPQRTSSRSSCSSLSFKNFQTKDQQNKKNKKQEFSLKKKQSEKQPAQGCSFWTTVKAENYVLWNITHFGTSVIFIYEKTTKESHSKLAKKRIVNELLI